LGFLNPGYAPLGFCNQSHLLKSMSIAFHLTQGLLQYSSSAVNKFFETMMF